MFSAVCQKKIPPAIKGTARALVAAPFNPKREVRDKPKKVPNGVGGWGLDSAGCVSTICMITYQKNQQIGWSIRLIIVTAIAICTFDIKSKV